MSSIVLFDLEIEVEEGKISIVEVDFTPSEPDHWGSTPERSYQGSDSEIDFKETDCSLSVWDGEKEIITECPSELIDKYIEQLCEKAEEMFEKLYNEMKEK